MHTNQHRAVAVTLMLNTDRTNKQRNKCTPKINTTLRFWILTVVVMEIQVFCNVMPHPYFNSYWCFTGASHLYFQSTRGRVH